MADYSEHLTVGWREWISLPKIHIPAVKTKIDTGARTSCLHTTNYEIFQKEGQDWVRFSVHPLKKRQEIETRAEAAVSDYRIVRDSGGHEEKRPFIKTLLEIGTQSWEIEISLSNRERMKFQMLLGRTGLRDRILVDCASSYLTGLRFKPNS
ncbi:MAG: ATP-dependent zinc protease [Akkermansiaceae bacterium]